MRRPWRPAIRARRECVERVGLHELCENAAPQLGVDQNQLWADRLAKSRFGEVGDACGVRATHTRPCRLLGRVVLAATRCCVGVRAKVLQKIAVPADGDVWMDIVFWLIAGAATFLVISVSLGLAIAAMLGGISSEVSRVLEAEPWALAPPARRERAVI